MSAADAVIGELIERVCAAEGRLSALEGQVARLTTGGASIATGALPIGMVPRAEAAKFLGLKVTTLHRWAHRGIGPEFTIWRNRSYYCRAVLEQWAADHLRKATRGTRRAPERGAPLLDSL